MIKVRVEQLQTNKKIQSKLYNSSQVNEIFKFQRWISPFDIRFIVIQRGFSSFLLILAFHSFFMTNKLIVLDMKKFEPTI